MTYLSRDSSVRFRFRENLFLAGWEAGPLRTPDDSSHSHVGAPRRAPPPGGGPVVPTGAAIAAQHPLPAAGARLTGGLLHEWQRRNADASMPLALHQLVVAGNLDNLQLAIRAAERPAPAPFARPAPAGPAPAAEAPAGADTPDGTPAPPSAPTAPRASGVTPPADLGYHGPVFMDSDIYKTLEAIGWELESAQHRSPGTEAQLHRPRTRRPPPGVRRLRRDRPSSCSPASSGRTAT